MSYIKKCNRCGKEMSKDSPDNEMHFTKKRNTKWGYDDVIHLCDKCIEKFDNFMNGGKINK